MHVGNSPPKVARTALLPDADAFQPLLVPRCGFQARLTPSVRPCGREANLQDRETQRPPYARDRPHPKRSQTDDQDRPRPKSKTGQDRRPRQPRQKTKTVQDNSPRRPPPPSQARPRHALPRVARPGLPGVGWDESGPRAGAGPPMKQRVRRASSGGTLMRKGRTPPDPSQQFRPLCCKKIISYTG